MTETLPPGKLDPRLLESMLRQVDLDDRVVIGPKVGEDAAVIDMGPRCLVVASDPVTLAGERAGWNLVHVNANDVATMGALPRWLLTTLLLPAGSATEAMVLELFGEIRRACRDVGCTLCGGHTEVTEAVGRPVLIGQMMGEVERERLVSSSGARPGDVLLLSKSIAIEGTAILAHRLRSRLDGAGLAAERALGATRLDEPGISVVPEAMAAVSSALPSAMHDPTEGGLAMGLHELASASGVGLRVDGAAVPILPECRRICGQLSIDPLGLIASGSLLIAAGPGDEAGIVEAVRAAGVSICRIGEVVPASEGLTISDVSGAVVPLPRYPQDELIRALGEVEP